MKKIPERTCMACNKQMPKQDLLRIVKSKDGIIEVDLTGKKNGRGAYICKNAECLKKAIKTGAYKIYIEDLILYLLGIIHYYCFDCAQKYRNNLRY